MLLTRGVYTRQDKQSLSVEDQNASHYRVRPFFTNKIGLPFHPNSNWLSIKPTVPK